LIRLKRAAFVVHQDDPHQIPPLLQRRPALIF
jgi:hypothetical protein